uniref:Uncharacterized protein n=1 Tax=Avena sativa TaxID=4498 RepID=A0ACD5YVP8_AVESA
MATIAKLLLLALVVISVQGSSGQRCSVKDVQVQTVTTARSGGNGNLLFEVRVKNLCPCSVRNVRVDGRGFDSTLQVDPSVFRAEGGGIYLLNGGGPIASMATVSFVYSWDHYFQLTPKSLDVEEDRCS